MLFHHCCLSFFFFFFNDTATTEIYTLSLHDALPLSGWDVDGGYDIYDARIDGGIKEPVPPPPSCQGDACQPTPRSLNDPTPSSSSFTGAGNQRARGNSRCAKGRHRVKARNGKSRCVKAKK